MEIAIVVRLSTEEKYGYQNESRVNVFAGAQLSDRKRVADKATLFSLMHFDLFSSLRPYEPANAGTDGHKYSLIDRPQYKTYGRVMTAFAFWKIGSYRL